MSFALVREDGNRFAFAICDRKLFDIPIFADKESSVRFFLAMIFRNSSALTLTFTDSIFCKAPPPFQFFGIVNYCAFFVNTFFIEKDG